VVTTYLLASFGIVNFFAVRTPAVLLQISEALIGANLTARAHPPISACPVPPNTAQAVVAAVGHTVGLIELRFFKSPFSVDCHQLVKAHVAEVEAVARWQLARDNIDAVTV
jgi:hypothetical protein